MDSAFVGMDPGMFFSEIYRCKSVGMDSARRRHGFFQFSSKTGRFVGMSRDFLHHTHTYRKKCEFMPTGHNPCRREFFADLSKCRVIAASPISCRNPSRQVYMG
jgi:hypothetical protein